MLYKKQLRIQKHLGKEHVSAQGLGSKTHLDSQVLPNQNLRLFAAGGSLTYVLVLYCYVVNHPKSWR